jgi:hypothetical protein
VVANLSQRRQRVPLEASLGDVLLASDEDWQAAADGVELPPESVLIAVSRRG